MLAADRNKLTNVSSGYTYDAADQMVNAGGISYGYDANGNQTSMGANTFNYDHENRLTQSVIGGVTSSSTYNGDGLIDLARTPRATRTTTCTTG